MCLCWSKSSNYISTQNDCFLVVIGDFRGAETLICSYSSTPWIALTHERMSGTNRSQSVQQVFLQNQRFSFRAVVVFHNFFASASILHGLITFFIMFHQFSPIYLGPGRESNSLNRDTHIFISPAEMLSLQRVSGLFQGLLLVEVKNLT